MKGHPLFVCTTTLLPLLLLAITTAVNSQVPSKNCHDGNSERIAKSSHFRCILGQISRVNPVDPTLTLNANSFDGIVQSQQEGFPQQPSLHLYKGKGRKHRKRKNKKRLSVEYEQQESAAPPSDENGKAIVNGIKSVDKVINEGRGFFHDGQKFDITSEVIPYHSGLAAQYGVLTSGTIKAMDEKLKVIIASTNRLMQKLQQNVDYIGSEIPFEAYLGVMHQNVLLKQKEDSEIVKSDMMGFDEMNWFKFDGSPDKKKVMKVHTWFTNLINDTDVLKDTKIEIEDLANIVAASGAAVEDFITLFYAKEYIERSIVDVGVLRYPDPMNPFFKLYRIKLFAFRKSTRVVVGQKDESGIKGDFEAVQFVPRTKVLRQMRKEVIKKAVSEAESMFDF